MLQTVSKWVVNQLVVRGEIAEQRKAVYLYGCELILSTGLSVLCILLAGGVAGRFGQALSFVLFFMPVRTVSSGYHAPSYGKCFVLTTLLAFLCVSGGVLCRAYVPVWVIWCLFVTAQLVIWLRGPFRSHKHPLKEELVKRNRQYMHRMQMVEMAAGAALCLAGKQEIFDTAVMATITVACMIVIAEKEEWKYVGNVGSAD